VFSEIIKDILGAAGVLKTDSATLSGSVDLRKWCSPVENQENLGSCTANAGVGMAEYFQRKAFGKHIDASRLFLYKVTWNPMHQTDDNGAYLRSTMGALALFGAPAGGVLALLH
jgi:C1A family cysteine protease